MIEVNPLVVTPDGRLLALDAKFNFDDNALYRQPEIVAMRDKICRALDARSSVTGYPRVGNDQVRLLLSEAVSPEKNQVRP